MHSHLTEDTNTTLTFKGSMSQVARNIRRWKFDMADRKSSGENWFKYLTKALKSCAQGNRSITKQSNYSMY